MKTFVASLLVLQDLVIACTATLTPSGEVYICPGQPQIFTCRVPNLVSSDRLEWRIDFEDSQSVASVTQQYTTADQEGRVLRDERSGLRFMFNLTSNSSPHLISTMTLMTVTPGNISGTSIDNAIIVNCGQESHPTAVLHVLKGPPTSPQNFTQYLIKSQRTNGTLMEIWWNSDDVVDYYIISVSPWPPNELQSTFTTPNATIQLSLLYNQEYNVTVVGSNCAGNSIPADINIKIGCCAPPTVGYMVSIEDNSSICEVEGSFITYYCQPGLVPSDRIMAYCMPGALIHMT